MWTFLFCLILVCLLLGLLIRVSFLNTRVQCLELLAGQTPTFDDLRVLTAPKK